MRTFLGTALAILSLFIAIGNSEAQTRQTFRSTQSLRPRTATPLRPPSIQAFNPYSTPGYGINYYWNSPANVASRLQANQNYQLYSQQLNNAVANQAAFSMNPWAYSGYNPYSYNAYSYGSTYPNYGYSMPYSSYGGSNYGASNYAAAAGVNPYVNQAAIGGAPATQQQPSTLAAYGIPSDNGRVRWPLALRLMPADKKRDLLDPLDAQLQILTLQAVAGRTNPTLLQEAHAKVVNVREWLRSHEFNLVQPSYREADEFLRRIDASLDRMQVG